MHFDDLLKILGEFGTYQKLRLFLICLVAIVCAFHAMNMVFVGAKPDFNCAGPDVNVSNPQYGNTTEEDIQSFVQSAGKCNIYDVEQTKNLLLSGNYSLAALESSNISVQKRSCQKWHYSQDVYGPTIVTQVMYFNVQSSFSILLVSMFFFLCKSIYIKVKKHRQGVFVPFFN